MIALSDSLREFLRSLREERGRTIVTLLGLGWGTFSIVVLLAFGTGLEGLLREKADNFGRRLAIVWPQRTTRPHAGMSEGRPVLIRAADVLALPRQIPEMELVSPEYMRRDRVTVGSRILPVQITGVHPAYGDLRSWRPREGGRFLDDGDIAERRRVAVLGSRIAEGLLGDGPAVGRTVTVSGLPFLVVGVLPPKLQDASYGDMDGNRLCIPATTFEGVFGHRFISNFVYRARDPSLQARVTDRVYEVIGGRSGFDPRDRAALWVWDTTEDERGRSYAFLGFHLMLGGSGALTLLVGGIGIGNLCFLRVRRRTREIGILMALGAKPRRILEGVLAESLILAGAGGSIGFAGAWAVVALARATPLAAHIGRPEISAALGGSTAILLGAVGVLAGYFPARRAARLDPVAALED